VARTGKKVRAQLERALAQAEARRKLPAYAVYICEAGRASDVNRYGFLDDEHDVTISVTVEEADFARDVAAIIDLAWQSYPERDEVLIRRAR